MQGLHTRSNSIFRRMGVDGEGIPARAETMATGKDAGDMLVCASDHKQFSVPNGFKSIVPNRA